MSRRDTMIIAVLVNVGLLIILFASALKTNLPGEELATRPSAFQEPAGTTLKKEVAMTGAGDEVDIALYQFAQNPVPTATMIPKLEPSAFSTQASLAQTTSANPFVEDLKAVATAEAPKNVPSQVPEAQTLIVPMPIPNKPFLEFIEIKVKKGDVLEKIARHHHTTVGEIMKLNQLTSTHLRIGQVLKIPTASIKSAKPSTIASSPQNEQYYIVKKGDSLWTIAIKHHLKVEDLLKVNQMTEEQARRLQAGDQLRIP